MAIMTIFSGQRKETYIYRLFSTGTMEEKVFQRQTFKSDLAEQLVAAQEDMTDITEFAVKELKRIFIYNKKVLFTLYILFHGDILTGNR